MSVENMLPFEVGSPSDARSSEGNINMIGQLAKYNAISMISNAMNDEIYGGRNDQTESLHASFPRLLLLLHIAEVQGEMESALANLISHLLSKLPKYRFLAPDQASSEVRLSGHRHPRMNRTQWDFLRGA
jgi:hypothetical protein